MPQLSSEFPNLIMSVGKEKRINMLELNTRIHNADLPDINYPYGNSFYDELSDFLRATNDAQSGIVSQFNEQREWVRDATDSIPLKDRLPPDAPVIVANKALLRCLSRLRSIDYAIGKKLGDEGNTLRLAIKNQLEATTRVMLEAVTDATDDDKKNSDALRRIKKEEERLNTFLVKQLHEANLTKGCNTPEEAEKLLFHYRNLSSLLTPARTIVTLTFDKTAQVFQRETQYPITKKSDEQIYAIESLKRIQPYPFKEEKNAHNIRNIATQEADCLFYELMIDNQRTLAAQARKTHLVGIKNAYIVKNELIFLNENLTLADAKTEQATPDNTLWLARTAVPVYVGSGENQTCVQSHTQHNLEQIRQAASDAMVDNGIVLNNMLALHVTCLNTYSPLENQNIMVSHLYQATRKRTNGDDISYMPVNPDGTFRRLDLAKGLFASDETPPSGIAPLQKATRLNSVSTVVLHAAAKPGTLSVVQCASGQDRTGTAVEKATQEWMAGRYDVRGLAITNIETMRAEGGNAAEITSHHVPGSEGMKKESMANNALDSRRTFSKEASGRFYLASANTNKKNTIGTATFLKNSTLQAVKEFNDAQQAFLNDLHNYHKTNFADRKKYQFYLCGLSLWREIHKIAGSNPAKLDSESLNQLTSLLPHCSILLTEQNGNTAKMNESLRRLASFSQHLPGKASPAWQALGVSLITFACLGLVVAGILAAIPSGGSSLLLAVVGATGLSTGAAVSLGAAGIASCAIAGITLFHTDSQKDLSKSVSRFETAFQSIPHDPNEPYIVDLNYSASY